MCTSSVKADELLCSSRRVHSQTRLSPEPFQNQAATLVTDKPQKFLSHSSGGWESEIRVPAGLGSGNSHLLVADGPLLLVPSHNRQLSEVPLLVLSIQFMA